MKINDILYKTPEMTEEKLLEIINNNLQELESKVGKRLLNRIELIYKYSEPLNKLILKEFDNIQMKKSYLTKSERTMITGFVGICLIKMTKGNGTNRE